jgi:hypothetical protein
MKGTQPSVPAVVNMPQAAVIHVTSRAYANNPVTTTALPSQNGPPMYQASSPYIIQKPHPYDIRPSGPHMNTSRDYAEALQRGISERSPIAAYGGNGYQVPGYSVMSNASGPYHQSLIPNPHYSVTSAVEVYHRMHPNESAADLALRCWSPNGSNPSYVLPLDKKPKGIMKGTQPSVPAVVNMPKGTAIPPVNAMPPHTSTRGYGHPGYSSNPLLSPQPIPPASYMNVAPPTPYSHHASFAYANQSQATSMGTALRGIKTRNSIS